jgi:hypothetical protein
MALIDPSDITELTDRLGDAELALITARDINTNGSAMNRLAAARDYVYDMGATLNGTEFDNILALATSIRGSEVTMMDYLETTLEDSVNALNTYFVNTVGKAMRAYYTGIDVATTVTWDVNFRSLWRRIREEEIIIALATGSRSGGTWSVSYDADGIELPSGLEVRTEALVGASDIIVTLVLDVDDTTTATIGIRIPAETVADTAFTVQNTLYTEFIGVSSMSVTGGTNGDSIKLWVGV